VVRTLLERLNALDRVIPVHLEDSEVLLLNRQEILWVKPGPDVDDDWVAPPAYQVTREERVVLDLGDSASLDGVLRMELPQEFNRVSDFMNGPEDFLPLATGEGLVLVNKQHVRATRLFRASPLPIRPRPSRV
jgi:hypothetical protein